MNRGFIKLYRKIQDNFLWQENRTFSKAEAWIDILMEIRHDPDPTTVLIGMTPYQCHRGESIKSSLTWSKRWGWSTGKVRRFLQMLKECGMIDIETDTKTTRIKVLNFDIYNKMADDSFKSMPYREYLKTNHWKQVREKAIKKAGFKCQLCNSFSKFLNVHHRDYDRLGNERDTDVIALCKTCHEKFHDIEGDPQP